MDNIVLVFINWIDAHMDDELGDMEYPQGIPGIVCGILIHINEKAVIVGLQLFDDLDARQILTIPKKMITKMSMQKLGSFKEVINFEPEEKGNKVSDETSKPEQTTEATDAPSVFERALEEYEHQNPK